MSRHEIKIPVINNEDETRLTQRSKVKRKTRS